MHDCGGRHTSCFASLQPCAHLSSSWPELQNVKSFTQKIMKNNFQPKNTKIFCFGRFLHADISVTFHNSGPGWTAPQAGVSKQEAAADKAIIR